MHCMQGPLQAFSITQEAALDAFVADLSEVRSLQGQIAVRVDLTDTDLLSRLHCTFCLLYLLYSLTYGMTAWEHT